MINNNKILVNNNYNKKNKAQMNILSFQGNLDRGKNYGRIEWN